MPAQESIRSMLASGRHRLSAGRAAEVAGLVLKHPKTARQLFECLWDEDPGVVNRAADALERLSHHLPTVLVP
jgi:hypothetical protein